MTHPNPHTVLDLETGDTYLAQAAEALLSMAYLTESLQECLDEALDNGKLALAGSLGVLGLRYRESLQELHTGNHDALQAAMEALEAQTQRVNLLFAD